MDALYYYCTCFDCPQQYYAIMLGFKISHHTSQSIYCPAFKPFLLDFLFTGHTANEESKTSFHARIKQRLALLHPIIPRRSSLKYFHTNRAPLPSINSP